MSVYKARWRNALKQAAKVNRLLRKGYLIYDNHGEKVVKYQYNPITRSLFQEVVNTPNCIVRYLFFQNDTNYDHGLFTTVKKFNQTFNDWRIIHPKDFRKFNEVKA